MAEPRIVSPDDPKITDQLARRTESRLDRFADSMRRLAPGEMKKLREGAIRDSRVTVADLKSDFTSAANADLSRVLAQAAADAKPTRPSRLAWSPEDGDE